MTRAAIIQCNSDICDYLREGTMKLIRMVAIAVLAILVQTCQLQAQDSIVDVVKKVKPAVVTITTYESGKESRQGTGFLIGADTVITNFHVVEGASEAHVRTPSGETYAVKEITASEPVADVARLKLSEPVKDAKPLALLKSLPREGEKIVVVGSPLGLEQTVSDGIVSAIREIPGLGKFLQISAPISPGSSGSPVLNLKGEVVGIVVGTITEGQNLNFAVASEYVLSLKSAGAIQLGKSEPGTQDSIWRDIRKGAECGLRGEYAKALSYYDLAAESCNRKGNKTRQCAVVHCLRAGACGMLDRWTEAVASYRQVIEIAPEWVEAHNWLGYAYHRLGQYEKEVECLKTALRLKPDYYLAQYSLALAYDKLGRTEDCIDALKQAIRIEPDNADAHNALGIEYSKLHRYEEAADEFKTAIRTKPDDATLYYNLADAYIQQMKFEEGIEAYKQAIRINPDYTNAHGQLAICYLVLLKDKAAALEEYKIIKKLDPQLADKLFKLIYE